MSNFSELQCFNKLLLDKMQRMQKKMEKLEWKNKILTEKSDKYFLKYGYLLECADLGDVVECAECELYHTYDDSREIDGYCVCDKCWVDKKYFECDDCCEAYCSEGLGHTLHIKSKDDGSIYICELCESCWNTEKKRLHKVCMEELLIKLGVRCSEEDSMICNRCKCSLKCMGYENGKINTCYDCFKTN